MSVLRVSGTRTFCDHSHVKHFRKSQRLKTCIGAATAGGEFHDYRTKVTGNCEGKLLTEKIIVV